MARIAAAFVCLTLAAPLMAAPALAQDAPIPTTRTAERVATPAPAATSPAVPTSALAPNTAPADDYGYVAWCYGAVSGYVDQYAVAMPEVTRIERAFPTPSTEENIKKIYPEQRDAAKASLPLYRAAITAAEKASSRPISAYGAQAVTRGRSVWNGYAAANKARLAQFWMGWAAPADCDTRAKTLQAKSELMGQALSFNATSAGEVMAAPPEAAPEAAPAAEATPDAALAPTSATPTSIDDLLGAAPAEAAEPAKVASAAPAKARAKPVLKLRGAQ